MMQRTALVVTRDGTAATLLKWLVRSTSATASTVFAGVAFEDADSGDNELFNFYATYETGAWLFAAELNVGENERVGSLDDVDVLEWSVDG